MLFTFTDLEPRKKAEEALRKSEERFAKAFRMAPVPSLVLYGDDLQALDINQAFSETFGYQAEELLGESTVACGLWQDGGAERLGELLAQSGSVRNVRAPAAQGSQRPGLPGLGRGGEPQRAGLRAGGLAGHQRPAAHRNGAVHAIETVMQDASWFSRTLIEKLANVRRANAPGTGAELADLTAREREVFDLICQGLADKEIAKELGLAPNTVRNHVATIYAKLDVHSRGEAIVWARERGFAPEPRNGSGANKRRGYECTRAAGAFVPVPSAPTLAQHARHAPPVVVHLFSAARAAPSHVCSPRQFRSGGGFPLLSNICPSASAGARRHPAGRLRMLGTGVVKF